MYFYVRVLHLRIAPLLRLWQWRVLEMCVTVLFRAKPPHTTWLSLSLAGNGRLIKPSPPPSPYLSYNCQHTCLSLSCLLFYFPSFCPPLLHTNSSTFLKCSLTSTLPFIFSYVLSSLSFFSNISCSSLHHSFLYDF